MTTHEFATWLLLMGFHLSVTGHKSYTIIRPNGIFCRVTIALMIKVEWAPAHPDKDQVNFTYVNGAAALEDIKKGLGLEVQDGRVR